MYSKVTGEGVKFSNTEYNNQPNKVIILQKVIANKLNEKRKIELESKINGAK